MDEELAAKLRYVEEKFPVVTYIPRAALFTSVQRMKAERELGIPVEYRSGVAISVKFGKAANELAEQQWEEFFQTLSNSLRQKYPEMYERLFGANNHPADEAEGT